MANIKKRSTTWTLTEVDGRQVYQGPGVIRAASMDGTSLSSNVVTLYDSADKNASVTGPTISTWTQDTDFGQTGLATAYCNGSIQATVGTTSDNTHLGVPFANGLYAVKSGDTTHTAAMVFLIQPLIKKTINIDGRAGTTHEAPVFDGPGILHGISIKADLTGVSTTGDIVFEDGQDGGVLWTGTNYVTTTQAMINACHTTGIDDAGTARTTAATGSYANPGIPFANGLHIAAAQLIADSRAYSIDVLIEA